jgi:hypothetical protein
MAFIEWELIHYKRTNLAVYQKFPVDFIDMKSWLNLLKGALPRYKKELDDLQKLLVDFIGPESWWHLLNESFYIRRIEHFVLRKVSSRSNWYNFSSEYNGGVLFHEKGRNLSVYKMLPVDFIGSNW